MKSYIKLDDIVMDAVVDENPTMSAEVTDNPVEKGQDVSDHMREKPYNVRLSGIIVNDSADKLEKLRNCIRDKKVLKYLGRNIFTNVVLVNLDTKHNADNATGFNYNLTLKHVRISQPQTFKVNVKDPKTNKQDAKTATKVKQKTNAGRKQVKKK